MNLRANIAIADAYFRKKGWKAQVFQIDCWKLALNGQSGLLNAPTGSGKTYALMLPYLLKAAAEKSDTLNILWLTPLRALSDEIKLAAQVLIDELSLGVTVGVRTGDTPLSERNRQKKKLPQLLITTPESLHLMLAQKGYTQTFSGLYAVVVDEWHELIGSKRGVQVELALSRLRGILAANGQQLSTWGISASIGNLEEAMMVLHGMQPSSAPVLVKASIDKKISIQTLIPDEVEKYPWSGHLGIHMLEKIIPLIESASSVLIFTNTRSQTEIWYRKLLEKLPELSGLMAMHHASLDKDIRIWVENALHDGRLKAVVCTSSLDLGVDFRPVDTIIQVGSPKGIARFLQRAGRSGHRPGAESKIYFLPTHSLEILEGAALKTAISTGAMEQRIPYIRSFDVLIQYLVTLAVADGFESETIFEEIKNTYSFESISREEWNKVLAFITLGGTLLDAYDEFRKVEIVNGIYKVQSKGIALRHRLSIGTIVSDSMLNVKLLHGGSLGMVEEWFVSKLQPGDVFWFAGRSLELVRIKEMTVQVKIAKKENGIVPAWMGGRMPLSSHLGEILRWELGQMQSRNGSEAEHQVLKPLFELQEQLSAVPSPDEFLVEYFESRDGYHLMMYPFEGRFVHEGMAALIAYRLAAHMPISFSIAMNDYGFELLSDTFMPVEEWIHQDLFSTQHLHEDILASVNAAEMARRKFRDIASIAGLVFQGWPGKQLKDRHLQASSQLFFNVFHTHEPDHLLLQQAFEEVLTFQLEEQRLRKAQQRICQQKFIIRKTKQPTPFSFPVITDRLRQKLSSEKWEDQLRKMTLKFELPTHS